MRSKFGVTQMRLIANNNRRDRIKNQLISAKITQVKVKIEEKQRDWFGYLLRMREDGAAKVYEEEGLREKTMIYIKGWM